MLHIDTLPETIMYFCRGSVVIIRYIHNNNVNMIDENKPHKQEFGKLGSAIWVRQLGTLGKN